MPQARVAFHRQNPSVWTHCLGSFTSVSAIDYQRLKPMVAKDVEVRGWFNPSIPFRSCNLTSIKYIPKRRYYEQMCVSCMCRFEVIGWLPSISLGMDLKPQRAHRYVLFLHFRTLQVWDNYFPLFSPICRILYCIYKLRLRVLKGSESHHFCRINPCWFIFRQWLHPSPSRTPTISISRPWVACEKCQANVVVCNTAIRASDPSERWVLSTSLIKHVIHLTILRK